MSDYQKRLIFRFALVFGVVAIGFACILGKIIIIQTTQRDQWAALEKTQQATKCKLEPRRGNIYDCNNRLLSGSIPTYRFFIDMKADPLTVKNNRRFNLYRDSIALCLATVIGEHSKEEYSKLLQNGFDKKMRRMPLHSGRISYTKYKELKAAPPFYGSVKRFGIYYEEHQQRVRPYGDLCSRTIGSTYSDSGNGKSGLEMRYNDLLYGKEGEAIEQKIGTTKEMVPITNAIDGKNIVTTIDADFQDIVDTELRNAMTQTNGEWGCCILMETATGEIKAISNLDRNETESYSEKVNHAVVRMEPGSMFKTIALMAALDDGKVALSDTFHVSRDGWVYNDKKHPITDSHYIEELGGVMTVKQGLTASSNIVLSKVVTSSYEKKADRFIRKLNNMGLDKTFPCEIPGAQTPFIPTPSDRETFARMSFGYSVELPPLYTLMYYNAIANNGRMVSPLIVKQIYSETGPSEMFYSKTLQHSICSSRTLAQVRECLESVVWDSLGTASARKWSRKAQSDKVHVAGKTGTARIFVSGRYLTTRHRIAFCGYFPMEQPRYTCICVIHDVQHRDAGNDCGGTVRRIAERVMAHHSIVQRSTDATADNKTEPHIKRGMTEPVVRISRDLDLAACESRDNRRTKWSDLNRNDNDVALSITGNKVPNVVGMGAIDAVYAIEQTGMIAVVNGTGQVIRQSVAEGTNPLKGGTVYLELRQM